MVPWSQTSPPNVPFGGLVTELPEKVNVVDPAVPLVVAVRQTWKTKPVFIIADAATIVHSGAVIVTAFVASSTG